MKLKRSKRDLSEWVDLALGGNTGIRHIYPVLYSLVAFVLRKGAYRLFLITCSKFKI